MTGQSNEVVDSVDEDGEGDRSSRSSTMVVTSMPMILTSMPSTEQSLERESDGMVASMISVKSKPSSQQHQQQQRLRQRTTQQQQRQQLAQRRVDEGNAESAASSTSEARLPPCCSSLSISAQPSISSTNALLSLPASPEQPAPVLFTKMQNITKSQMREYREAFKLFDKDGDGNITKEELGRVMRSLGQFARTEELHTMLKEIDIDGDGNVSFEEFVEIASNIGGTNTATPSDLDQEEQELRDAFRVFDKRNRGYITASDLRAVLQCLGEDLSEEEIEDMIKEVDVNGDGRIDFYEFVHALGEPEVDDDDDEDEEDDEDDYEEDDEDDEDDDDDDNNGDDVDNEDNNEKKNGDTYDDDDRKKTGEEEKQRSVT